MNSVFSENFTAAHSGIFPEGYNVKQIGIPFHTLKGSHNGDPNLPQPSFGQPQNPDSNAPCVRDGIPWHRQEDRAGSHDSGLAGPTNRVCVSVPVETLRDVDEILRKVAVSLVGKGLMANVDPSLGFTGDKLIAIGQIVAGTNGMLRRSYTA